MRYEKTKRHFSTLQWGEYNDKAYIIGTFTAMPEARKVLMKLKGEKA